MWRLLLSLTLSASVALAADTVSSQEEAPIEGSPTPSISPEPTPALPVEATPVPTVEMPDVAPSPSPTPQVWGDSPPAASEEDELALLFAAPVVSATTKSVVPESLDDSAAPVTVITKEEIAAFGYRTLSDLLLSVPEGFVAGNRSYDLAGLRGFARTADYNTRILLLLDGHVLNEAYGNYSPIGTDLPIDLRELERVEIVHGPVSALYGSSAFFGVINLVSREGAGGSVAAGGGSFGYASLSAAHTARTEDGWRIRVSTLGRSADGENLRFSDGYTERGTDWFRSGGASIRVTSARVQAHAFAFGRRRGIVGAGTSSEPKDARTWDQDERAGIGFDTKLFESAGFRARVRAHGDTFRWLEHDADDEGVETMIGASATWGGAEAVAEWSAGPSNLLVSVEEVWHDVSELGTEAGAGFVTGWALTRGTINETLQLGTRARLVAGLYSESSDEFGTNFAPRAGLIVHPWRGTTVKALYGHAFRNPSIFENSGGLKSETVDSGELVVSHRFGRADLFADAFYGDYRNLIAYDPDANTYVGRDLSRSGGTVGAQIRLRSATLRADASGFQREDSAEAQSPEWVGRALALVPLHRRTGTTAALRISGAGRRPATNGETLGDYSVVDATLGTEQLWRGVGLQVSATNLFDSRYDTDGRYAGPIPAPRRRFFAEARGSW